MRRVSGIAICSVSLRDADSVDGPSPVTNIGATPAAAAVDLLNILNKADSESASADNAFYTNSRGNGHLEFWLDFRLSKGVYPFSKHDPALPDGGIGHTPFTFRVISHCTDNLQHGGYPGPHEPTFQISLDDDDDSDSDHH